MVGAAGELGGTYIRGLIKTSQLSSYQNFWSALVSLYGFYFMSGLRFYFLALISFV